MDIDIDRYRYSRLQKVGRWIWDVLCWCSFFSRLWGWGMVLFQISGFYYTTNKILHVWVLWTRRGLGPTKEGCPKVGIFLASGMCIIRHTVPLIARIGRGAPRLLVGLETLS